MLSVLYVLYVIIFKIFGHHQQNGLYNKLLTGDNLERLNRLDSTKKELASRLVVQILSSTMDQYHKMKFPNSAIHKPQPRAANFRGVEDDDGGWGVPSTTPTQGSVHSSTIVNTVRYSEDKYVFKNTGLPV